MSITYPISLPTIPAPANFTINASSFSAMTQSPYSASQQVQLNQGQLWSFTVDYPPMSDAQAGGVAVPGDREAFDVLHDEEGPRRAERRQPPGFDTNTPGG